MAAPIITSITVVPNPVLPGGTTVVTYDATDPDNVTVQFPGGVSDASGGLTPATVSITVQDILTYILGPVTGWTVVQRMAPNDHIFDVTAP